MINMNKYLKFIHKSGIRVQNDGICVVRASSYRLNISTFEKQMINRLFLNASSSTLKISNKSASQAAWIRGYSRVIFEGDNKTVKNLINGLENNFGFYNWICDIRY